MRTIGVGGGREVLGTAFQSSEELFQRGSGEISISVILVKGEVHAITHTFCRRLLLSHKEQTSP